MILKIVNRSNGIKMNPQSFYMHHGLIIVSLVVDEDDDSQGCRVRFPNRTCHAVLR